MHPSLSPDFSLKALGAWVLIHWCSALLPPLDPDEQDFYEVLGLSGKTKSASLEEIRKAYKKKSLQLHPDKVTQRGGDVEQAKQDFLLVSEAHTVLSDPSKRQLYHAVQCSPTRYRFVSQQGGILQHPQQVYEHLGQASCAAKSRIVLLIAVFFGILLLQPILIVVKINHDNSTSGGVLADTDWVVLLIPLWLVHGLIVSLWAVLSFVTTNGKWMVVLTFLEQASWMAGEILLALRWDETLTNRYRVIFLPIYVATALRSIQAILTTRWIVLVRIPRMVTQRYLNHKILDGGRPYEELTPDERAELELQYELVHVPPDFVVDVDTLSELGEDDLEAIRVEASPEYEQAMMVYRGAVQTFSYVLFVMVPFVALVVSKVDGTIADTSWWLVFLPFWIHLGLGVLGSCFTCCCGTIVGEEVVLEAQESDEEDPEGDEKGDDEDVRADSRDGPTSPFVSAEGSMRDFNASTVAKGDGTSMTDADDRKPLSSTTLGEEQGAGSRTSPAPATPTTEEPQETTEGTNDGSSNDNDEASMGSEDFREWEGEAYRAWKEAHAEAEASSREAQARAQMKCCGLSWQLMFLCLIAGKLEQDYLREPGESEGYNAVWVIFPFLVVAGCVFGCCACFVYGAGLADVDVASGADVHGDGADAATKNHEENPPVKLTTDDPVDTNEALDDEPEVVVDAPAPDDDDDLD